jgi:hypothetical protein
MRRSPSRGPAAPRRPAPPGGRIVWLLLAVVFAFWWFGAGTLWRSSHWAHHTYLADAFLHGQLHLARVPNDAGDMAVVGEKLYVVFGPFPALLLLPLVPLFARETPDVLVLALTALAGVWAFHALLVRLYGAQDRARLACATLTFALGTAMHYGAAMGNVWLHAQITATALQVFALLAAADGRALATGVLLGLTVLTRPTVTLAAPFCAWLLWSGAGRRGTEAAAAHGADAPPAPGVRAWAGFALPIAAAAALHAVYNQARFGSPTDAGYRYILMGPDFAALVERYGRFSFHFLPGNLFGWLLRPPVWNGGALVPDPHGMSLLLTTPYLLLALWPRRVSRLEWLALASFAFVSLPSLLYYNDGWVHFGQRFALDGIALALLAASFGARRAPLPLVALLTVWGVAVGAWGLHWFKAGFRH